MSQRLWADEKYEEAWKTQLPGSVIFPLGESYLFFSCRKKSSCSHNRKLVMYGIVWADLIWFFFRDGESSSFVHISYECIIIIIIIHIHVYNVVASIQSQHYSVAFHFPFHNFMFLQRFSIRVWGRSLEWSIMRRSPACTSIAFIVGWLKSECCKVIGLVWLLWFWIPGEGNPLRTLYHHK